jgi:hypothetical protein
MANNLIAPSQDPTVPSFTNFANTITKFGLSKPFKFKIDSIQPLPVNVKFPGGAGSGAELLITTISIPTRKINTTQVPYKAFEFVVPTNATYPENQSWSVTILQDENLLFRKFFEDWSNALYNIETNQQQFVNTAIQFSLYTELSINDQKPPSKTIGTPINTSSDNNNTQMKVLRKYTLHGAFPSLIGGIQYSFTDNGNNFASFNVTFSYQYFTVEELNVQVSPASNTNTPPSSLPSNNSTSQTPSTAPIGKRGLRTKTIK